MTVGRKDPNTMSPEWNNPIGRGLVGPGTHWRSPVPVSATSWTFGAISWAFHARFIDSLGFLRQCASADMVLDIRRNDSCRGSQCS